MSAHSGRNGRARPGRLLAALAGERGQSLVIAALMIGALVCMLVLVVDLGHVYVQRRQAQNAADAGALAGARALADGETEQAAGAAAQSYMAGNGAEAVAVATDTAQGSVSVTARRSFRTFFAAAIGMPMASVQASARARYGTPRSMGGLMPVAISQNAYLIGKNLSSIHIWDSDKIGDASTGDLAGGHRGWLDFDGGGGGANQTRYWVEHGYPEPVSVGAWIEGEAGTQASVISAFTRHIGSIVYVPIYGSTEKVQGKVKYHIIGFAAFQVTGITSTGKEKHVDGRFVEEIVADPCCGIFDAGVRVVYLER